MINKVLNRHYLKKNAMSDSVVVVGSCMIDFVCYAPRLPREGETIRGSKFDTNFGGKGANQCVAAAKLGANTTMIARVGDDIWGNKYIKNFEESGVNYAHVHKTKNYANGVAQITVSETGANQIVIVAGANLRLSIEDVERAQEDIENAAVVVCQLETKPDVAMRSIELCRGVSILNGAPGLTDYDIELITSPTIFCVNETEASLFTGLEVNSVDDARVAVRVLLKKGCKCVILTLGSEGAIFASQEEPEVVHVPPPEIDCVDTTGAGDAFIGALAFLISNYKYLSLKELVATSCCIATDTCRRFGTQNSYSDSSVLKECLQWNCACK